MSDDFVTNFTAVAGRRGWTQFLGESHTYRFFGFSILRNIFWE